MKHHRITSTWNRWSLATSTRACSLLALSLGLSSVACVSEARYEEARSAIQVEQEGHRRAATELNLIKQENSELKAQAAQREEAKDASELAISEAKLGMTVAVKEREAAAELVTQLRGELARVGDHLRTYSAEKRQLALALESAEAHARKLAEVERKSTQLALVVRDTALLLPDPIASGEIELTVREGKAQLRMPNSRAFLPSGRALTPEANALVSGLVKLSTLHEGIAFEASELDPNASPDPVARMERFRALGDAFSDAGLSAERLVIRVPDAARPAVQGASEASATPEEEAGVSLAPASPETASDASAVADSNAVETAAQPASAPAPDKRAPALDVDLVITVQL